MGREWVFFVLIVLGACASGPREGDAPPSLLPVPRIDDEQLEKVGLDAGSSLAASTTAMAAIGRTGTVRWARVANLIPWRELKDFDQARLREAFAARCPATTVMGVSSFAVAVDALTFVRRARDAVQVEYSFDFILVGPDGATPWAKCLTVAVEGGRGELVPRALTLRELDLLAGQAANSVVEGLKSVGATSVEIVPHPREGPGSALGVAFEDRVRVALLERGASLVGKGRFVVELDASLETIQRETGAEIYEFRVDLSRVESSVPFRPWRRLKTCSSTERP